MIETRAANIARLGIVYRIPETAVIGPSAARMRTAHSASTNEIRKPTNTAIAAR